MSHDPTNPKPPPPPGTIELEFTDFETARQALDLPPEGLDRVASFAPDYWEQRRRKPVPSDRALTSEALQWLISLPQEVRPRLLCDRYPRVANALALIWDRPERLPALDALLTDRRGGRKGFAPEITSELRALRAACDTDPRLRPGAGG
jgi:hypothetical protein